MVPRQGWVVARRAPDAEAKEREGEGVVEALVEQANQAEKEVSKASCDNAPPPMRSD